MPTQSYSNLEPIDEGDLNLKDKFLGGVPAEKSATEKEPVSQEEKVENVFPPEKAVERKEGRMEKEAAYAKILSKVTTPAPVFNEEVDMDAKGVSLEQDEESKIGNLVKLAEIKGIPHAVKVARHLEDNYALDEFHDRLLGEELHNALVDKGLIKEI